MNRKNSRKLRLFLFLTFVIVMSCFMTNKAFAISDENAKMGTQRNYLAQKEKEYRAELVSCLAQNGYSNSGITMTKIIDEVGNITYQVGIHHRNFEALTSAQKECLRQKLNKPTFVPNGSVLEHKFL